MAINAAIIILGFWAPWIEAWGIGRRVTLLEWLALELARTGLVRFTVAVPLVIVVSALIAARARCCAFGVPLTWARARSTAWT